MEEFSLVQHPHHHQCGRQGVHCARHLVVDASAFGVTTSVAVLFGIRCISGHAGFSLVQHAPSPSPMQTTRFSLCQRRCCWFHATMTAAVLFGIHYKSSQLPAGWRPPRLGPVWHRLQMSQAGSVMDKQLKHHEGPSSPAPPAPWAISCGCCTTTARHLRLLGFRRGGGFAGSS